MILIQVLFLISDSNYFITIQIYGGGDDDASLFKNYFFDIQIFKFSSLFDY